VYRRVDQDQCEFAEFYAAAWDDCLRIVMVSVGNRALGEDLVAEAFTRAWASWRRYAGWTSRGRGSSAAR
jgi:DNA-directed RNA polymerase specialized sigma24 family protein